MENISTYYFEDVIMRKEDLDLFASVESLKEFAYVVLSAAKVYIPGRKNTELFRVSFDVWEKVSKNTFLTILKHLICVLFCRYSVSVVVFKYLIPIVYI